MIETTLSFDACAEVGADADACRAGIIPLLAPGMDWSEVHCGRCRRTGIVRHADLVTAPVPEVEATPDPEPEPEADEPRTSKGGKA